MTPNEWIVGDDTGISSKTIWAVMMNSVPENPNPYRFDVPKDPSDFGRCYRLLIWFPEWRERLGEVAEKFPAWGPLVRKWDRMTELYLRDLKTGKSSELYDLMRVLVDEGRLEDGWKKTGPCSWEKTL